MGSFILGVNIVLNTVHVFVRDRSVPTLVKGLGVCVSVCVCVWGGGGYAPRPL